MTNEEAIEIVKENIQQVKELQNVLTGRMNTECQRDIDGLLAAIPALEKQIPKKLGKADFGNHKNFFDKCPNCGYESAGSHFKYCHECGQRLDWGD